MSHLLHIVNPGLLLSTPTLHFILPLSEVIFVKEDVGDKFAKKESLEKERTKVCQ